MKEAQRPDQVILSKLIQWLRDGCFVIPDFQRDFEWRPWDIRDLMRSIFLDYYIGSLLLWKGKNDNFGALACEPIYGFGDSNLDPKHIVLDGQQRLTAMFYTFMAPNTPLPNRKNRYLYFIDVEKFMNEEYDESFTYEWTKNSIKKMVDQDYQFRNHMFPLSIMGDHNGWILFEWIQNYGNYWETENNVNYARMAKDFGEYIQELIHNYKVSYIELDEDLDISKVCDIFTQVNSKGIRLDVFDLINAMLKPKGLQLKYMWREVAPRLDFVDTDRMNVYILQVMSIIRQTYCSPKYLYYLLPGQYKTVRDNKGLLKKEILISDILAFKNLWEESVVAVEKAIKLLNHPQELGVVSSQYIPYVSIIPVLASLHRYLASIDPFLQLEARKKIDRWYWASIFTNRYSGSVESTAARDYTEVCRWIDDEKAILAVIEEFRSRSLEVHREKRKGTSIYNGIFNLFVLNGARDWITGGVPQYGDLDDHHIVPKRWGQELGLANKIDSILNRTPLTTQTNRMVISDSLPNKYLPELIKKNDEKSVRDTLKTHLVTDEAFDILLRDPFGTTDFEEFIVARQYAIVEAITSKVVVEDDSICL